MAFEPRLLKNAADLVGCEAELQRLRRLAADAGIANRIELLTKLIELYEAEDLARNAITALDAIRLRMAQRGLRQRDLAVWLGGRNRASEVLAGKRPLTARMVAALSTALNIPVALLSAAAAPRSGRKSQ